MGKHVNTKVEVDHLSLGAPSYHPASLNPKTAKHRAFVTGDRVFYHHSVKGYIEGILVTREKAGTWAQWPRFVSNDGYALGRVVDPKRLVLIQSAHSTPDAAA